MINYIYELCKEHDCAINLCIGVDGAMTITVFAKHRDHISINALSFSDDEIIEITKDVIRRAKDEWK